MKLSELAGLAGLAYRCFGESEQEHCQHINREVEKYGMVAVCFGQDGTEGYIAYQPEKKLAYVVFRGTEASWVDLKHDLCAWPVANTSGPGKVHEGVQDALQRVWPEVLAHLHDMEVVNVHFTGHSLGAMLAVLAASWCYTDMRDVVVDGVTGFGGPPIGDFMFAGALGFVLRGRIKHVINGVDIVPRLITTRFLMGYRYPGMIQYITPDCRLIDCPGRCRRIWDVLMAYGKAFTDFSCGRGFTTPGVSAHSIRQYESRLKQAEECC